MSKMGIKVGHIILTGSASKMPFAPQIVLEVFNEISSDSLGYDMDPSRTISKGLALVGPSNEKSEAFRKDLKTLVDEKLGTIIKNNIPALSKKMGEVISGVIKPVIKNRVSEWKKGDITTLNGMNQKIKNDCSEANLTKLLSSNKEYTNAIEIWLRDSVGKDIAVELKALCTKYGVTDIGVDDLNVMKAPKMSINGELKLDPLAFMDTVAAIVSMIAGFIVGISITSILYVILSIIAIVSETIAMTLLTAILAMGPAGLVILAAAAGIAVGVLIRKGKDALKEMFKDKILTWDLPAVVRKTMTDEKINSSLTKANIPKQIEDAFNKPDLVNEIVNKISENLKGQIEKRAEDIKYAIESK